MFSVVAGFHPRTNMSHVGKPFNVSWWRPVTDVSQDVVYQFLSFLFHEKNLKLLAIAVYHAALKDPLTYSFYLTLDPLSVDLIHKRFFHQHPAPL